MSCSKCIVDWLIRIHVWWSRCTDRYQLWDKPFSKVNNRRKKTTLSNFFLMCWHISWVFSPKCKMYLVCMCFFYLAFSQSRSTFICLLVSFFLECVYVWFLFMECCLVLSFQRFVCTSKMSKLFFHIRMTCNFDSIGNIEILFDYIFFLVCQTRHKFKWDLNRTHW